MAKLAGISVDYYVQIERGRAPGVSDDVVAALARALRLTEDEATYVHARARTNAPAAAVAPEAIPQTVKSVLDAITGVPAVVYNRRLDMLGANPLGSALYAPVYEFSAQPPNLAHHVFLDPQAGAFYPDWNNIAEDTAALLRRGLPDSEQLVEELLHASEYFQQSWAAHHVHDHAGGLKRINHPRFGEFLFRYESLAISSAPGLSLVSYLPADERTTMLLKGMTPG